MAEIINLRQARKALDRAAKHRVAERNRAANGRTGAEKKASKAEAARQQRLLDSARRETE
ncbi:DUF4169 domain-containing protein [Sphingomonas deserti]|uniref:DUF4169 domain-containing protein n=2 Tax=Allosphingosinicella deserti TaxID=2116704 RepID=A0A2P7QS86_9SPHN|nr:DUF4169 family protein [Sphingomonas deserti]PSJ40825.1 DUF4169 domain-containing protein [Sphingomonas deserti]